MKIHFIDMTPDLIAITNILNMYEKVMPSAAAFLFSIKNPIL